MMDAFPILARPISQPCTRLQWTRRRFFDHRLASFVEILAHLLGWSRGLIPLATSISGSASQGQAEAGLIGRAPVKARLRSAPF